MRAAILLQACVAAVPFSSAESPIVLGHLGGFFPLIISVLRSCGALVHLKARCYRHLS